MNKFCGLILLILSLSVVAQVDEQPGPSQDNAVAASPNVTATTVTTATPANSPAANSPAANRGASGEASIDLRTTVTGNQEQPQVMYILPWQSPLSPELDMEMLGSEADSVFGHVERDELHRQLEAAGEFDTTN